MRILVDSRALAVKDNQNWWIIDQEGNTVVKMLQVLRHKVHVVFPYATSNSGVATNEDLVALRCINARDQIIAKDYTFLTSDIFIGKEVPESMDIVDFSEIEILILDEEASWKDIFNYINHPSGRGRVRETK